MPIPKSDTFAPMPIFAARSPFDGGGGTGGVRNTKELDSFGAGAADKIAATIASFAAAAVLEALVDSLDTAVADELVKLAFS